MNLLYSCLPLLLSILNLTINPTVALSLPQNITLSGPHDPIADETIVYPIINSNLDLYIDNEPLVRLDPGDLYTFLSLVRSEVDHNHPRAERIPGHSFIRIDADKRLMAYVEEDETGPLTWGQVSDVLKGVFQFEFERGNPMQIVYEVRVRGTEPIVARGLLLGRGYAERVDGKRVQTT